VVRSRVPIAIGHELSIALVAVLVLGASAVISAAALHVAAAAVLLCLGIFRFLKPRALAVDDDARERSRADRVVVSDVDRARCRSDGGGGAERPAGRFAGVGARAEVLRRAWVNTDRLWAVVFIVAAAPTLFTA
jgi:voltage-gated potassium channel Kch